MTFAADMTFARKSLSLRMKPPRRLSSRLMRRHSQSLHPQAF